VRDEGNVMEVAESRRVAFAAALEPFGKKADPLRAPAMFVGQRGR